MFSLSQLVDEKIEKSRNHSFDNSILSRDRVEVDFFTGFVESCTDR